jgi:hypothetical protein
MDTNIARFLIIWFLTSVIGLRDPIKAIWIAVPIFILSTLLFPTTKSWSVSHICSYPNSRGKRVCLDTAPIYYQVKCRAVFFCQATMTDIYDDDN